MGKKIALSIFGSIAVIGVFVMVVGFAMGGRPGGVMVQEGQFVYKTFNESIPLGQAPAGWSDSWFTVVGETTPYITGGHTGEWHETDHGAITSHFQNAGELILPEGAQNAKRFDIEVSAGYVTVVQGERFSVQVNGPLAVDITARGDECEVSSKYDTSRITTNPVSGKPRFYMDGKDVTTEYLITVPAGRQKVDAKLDMGVLTVTGLTAEQGEFSLDVGTMAIDNCAVNLCEISTDVGAVTVTGFTGAGCKLDVSVGNIDFQGSVSDTLEADCELGHISATLPRPDTYGERVKVSLGSVTIDGHGVSGIDGQRENNLDARPFFDLECDLGSIEIIFR